MVVSLRDYKRSLTEQTIVEKAEALFKEHGFDQVSIKQIAKAATISEKTVFNYFPYKELIVLAIAQPPLTAFMDEIQKQVDEITEATTILRNFSEGLCEICLSDPETTSIVISELLTMDPQRLEQTMRYVPDPYSPIRTVMTVARSQGRLRPEINIEYATDFFISNVLNVIRKHFANGRLEKVRPMVNVAFEVFLHGAFLPQPPEQQNTAP